MSLGPTSTFPCRQAWLASPWAPAPGEELGELQREVCLEGFHLLPPLECPGFRNVGGSCEPLSVHLPCPPLPGFLQGRLTRVMASPWPHACVAPILPQSSEKALHTFAYTAPYPGRLCLPLPFRVQPTANSPCTLFLQLPAPIPLGCDPPRTPLCTKHTPLLMGPL